MATEPEPTLMTTLDTLFVDVPISAVDAGGAAVALAGKPVELAFMPKGATPGSADWKAASWNPAATAAGLLVGPGTGGVVYPAGKYVAWWKVTDNPEVPARPAPYPGAGPLLIIRET